MSLSAKNDSDHSLNTLTDVVRLLGDTRHDVKKLDSKVEKGFIDTRADIARLQSDNTELKADNAEIKEMLSAILSRLPNN